MINLIEKHTNNNFSNKWRNISAVFLIIGVGFGWFWYTAGDHTTYIEKYIRGEKLQEMGDVSVENNGTGIVGGDVVFEPILDKVPVLAADSTAFDTDILTADSILVKDVQSGAVLLNKNEYAKHSIASITKLMTALVILEYDINWNATTTVIGADSLDTHMYAGDIYMYEELWNAMLIASSNKAALSLVESINGTEDEFVVRMNKRAQELGLSDTVFTDVTGIEDTNISTASDIVILLQEALRHPQIQETLLKKEYTLYSEQRQKEHHMWSTNWLILDDPNPWIYHSFDTVLGGKTGYIVAAGFNFVVEVEKGGHHIDVVVLGADSNEARFTEARDVGEWVFDNYTWEE